MISHIYAPPYYKNFECIKGACRHTCCAGWRIGIDTDTLSLYETMEGDLGHTVRKWIETDEDGAYIPLTECGRCPHLDEDGLCRIISALGNEAVSEICREHPRFYNSAGDRLEVGIGMSCEAAAELILSSDEYFPAICVGECDAENAECEFIRERDRMLEMLADKSTEYRDKLILLINKYQIPKDILFGERWRKTFNELEYKTDESAKLFTSAISNGTFGRDELLERFLAYMIYRHVTAAESYTDMRARLSFCLLSAAVLESMTVSSGADTLDEVAELARIYSDEIEYSEDNTDALIFEIECEII